MRYQLWAWLGILALQQSVLALALPFSAKDVIPIAPVAGPQRPFGAAGHLDARRKKSNKHKHKSGQVLKKHKSTTSSTASKTTKTTLTTRATSAATSSSSTSVTANASKLKCQAKQVTSSSSASSSSTTSRSSTSTRSVTTFTATSTTATATSTSTAAKASSTVAGSTLVLTSNNANYSYSQLYVDYKKIVKWADDEDQLNSTQVKETLSAILSASARYFPEVDTKVMARIVLADIKAESDFDADNVSGGRLDSGASVGLLQVSPSGGSQELALWKKHAQVNNHTATGSAVIKAVKASGVQGALIDWKTGETMNMTSLTYSDVLRPWINIHMALWIQSNLARTSSSDPYDWKAISKGTAKIADTGGTNTTPSVQTGLGSWVAGPGADSDGYRTTGDDISTQYFTNIIQGVRVLYSNSSIPTSWLGQWTLKSGLIDYY